jgi:hypothetical protein
MLINDSPFKKRGYSKRIQIPNREQKRPVMSFSCGKSNLEFLNKNIQRNNLINESIKRNLFFEQNPEKILQELMVKKFYYSRRLIRIARRNSGKEEEYTSRFYSKDSEIITFRVDDDHNLGLSNYLKGLSCNYKKSSFINQSIMRNRSLRRDNNFLLIDLIQNHLRSAIHVLRKIGSYFGRIFGRNSISSPRTPHHNIKNNLKEAKKRVKDRLYEYLIKKGGKKPPS